VMDVAMPGKDGFETLRELRAAPETASIPVVALTALAMSADAERVRAAGFDAYLTKPVDRALLVQTVRRLVRPA
jgi:CheY-like chemotaxis protein